MADPPTLRNRGPQLKRIIDSRYARHQRNPRAIPHPTPQEIIADEDPICLMISGIRSEPNDGLFDRIQREPLLKFGIHPIRFGFKGPGVEWGPLDTCESDYNWMSDLVECHLETRPNAKSIVLLAHSAGGATISDTVAKFGLRRGGSRLNGVVAVIGLAAIFGLHANAPYVPVPDSPDALKIHNYQGRPSALCEEQIPILSFMGTEDEVLLPPERPLWDVSRFFTSHDQQLIQTGEVNHLSVCNHDSTIDAIDGLFTRLRAKGLI